MTPPNSKKSLLDDLSEEEAARIRAHLGECRSDPAFIRMKQLFKKFNDGTATPEELAEYEKEIRPIRERLTSHGDRKVYDDRG